MTGSDDGAERRHPSAIDGRPDDSQKDRTARPAWSRLHLLAGLAVVSWLVYLAICLSGQSLYETGTGQHSLLAVLGLFFLAFGLYLLALRTALRADSNKTLVTLVVTAAVAFRITMLFSDPIEEIDLYRYMWDGIASTSGVNPYRYSPDQVIAASASDNLPPDLARLVSRRDSSPEVAQVLHRVHFGELPTIYPPVSQAVFAGVAAVVPDEATLWTRMIAMKAAFVAFDLATLVVLLALLSFLRWHLGWSVVYAWCPLVLKEIANSGHLDALAIFCTMLALYLAVRAITSHDDVRTRHDILSGCCLGAACLLALGVGAKLYPIILAPLLLGTFFRRYGRRAVLPGLVFVGTTVLVLWPMLPQASSASREVIEQQTVASDLPPLPPPESSLEPQDPSHSLRIFLGQWEMNDFLFLLVVENLRPTGELPPQETAWFSVVPEAWRVEFNSLMSRTLSVDASLAPFLGTRIVLSMVFFALMGCFAVRGIHTTSPPEWLGAAFLTIAWFWLLLPTLNPWYWTWAVPLLPFARGRAWRWLSGLVLLYYFRFWLVHHYLNVPVPGSSYSGALFFDYVVTWVEFGPWFMWLAIESLMRTIGRNRPRTTGAGE